MEASPEQEKVPLAEQAQPAAPASNPPLGIESESHSEKCQCWGKWWFIAIVILSWVILAGLIGLGIFSAIKWTKARSEMIEARDKNTVVENEWKKVNITLRQLESDINKTTEALIAEKKTLLDLIEKEGNLSKKFHDREVEYGDVKKLLDAATHERDEYKKHIEDIKKENEVIDKEVKNLTATAEQMKHKIKTDDEEIGVLKITTYVIGGVFALGTLDDVLTHINLWNIQAEIKKLYPYIAGFTAMSEAYENYELLSWHSKKKVTRTQCFHNGNKQDLSNCANKGPTITTISTADKFRFGCVLHENWLTQNGKLNDPKAFAFSSTHGQKAPIKIPDTAMKVDDAHLMQFGDGDIALVDQSHGKVGSHTYDIPHPFTSTTFYFNGTDFAASDLTVETIATVLI